MMTQEEISAREAAAKSALQHDLLVDGFVQAKVYLITKPMGNSQTLVPVVKSINVAADFALNLAAEYHSHPNDSLGLKFSHAIKASSTDIVLSMYLPGYGYFMIASSVCGNVADLLGTRLFNEQYTVYRNQIPQLIANDLGVAVPLGKNRENFLLEVGKIIYGSDAENSSASIGRALSCLGIEDHTLPMRRKFIQAVDNNCLGYDLKLYNTLKLLALPSELRDRWIHGNSKRTQFDLQPSGNDTHVNYLEGETSSAISASTDTTEVHNKPKKSAGVPVWEKYATPDLRVSENNTLGRLGAVAVQKPGFKLSNSTTKVIELGVALQFGGPTATIISTVTVAPVALGMLIWDIAKHKKNKEISSQINQHYKKAVDLFNSRLEEVQHTNEDGTTSKYCKLKSAYDYRELIPALINAMANDESTTEIAKEYQNRAWAYHNISKESAEEIRKGAEIHRNTSRYSGLGRKECEDKLQKYDESYAEMSGQHHERMKEQYITELCLDYENDNNFEGCLKHFREDNSSPAIKQKAADYFLLNGIKRVCSGQPYDENFATEFEEFSKFSLASDQYENLLAMMFFLRKVQNPRAIELYDSISEKMLQRIKESNGNIAPTVIDQFGRLLLANYISVEQDGDTVVTKFTNTESAEAEKMFRKLAETMEEIDNQENQAGARATQEAPVAKSRLLLLKESIKRQQARHRCGTIDPLGAAAASVLRRGRSHTSGSPVAADVHSSNPAKKVFIPSQKAIHNLAQAKARFFNNVNDMDLLLSYLKCLADVDASQQEIVQAFNSLNYLELAQDGKFRSAYEALLECVESGFIDKKNAIAIYVNLTNVVDENIKKLVDNPEISTSEKANLIHSINALIVNFTDYSLATRGGINELDVKHYVEKLKTIALGLEAASSDQVKKAIEELEKTEIAANNTLYQRGMDRAELCQYFIDWPLRMTLEKILENYDKNGKYEYFKKIIPILSSIAEVFSRTYQVKMTEGRVDAGMAILAGSLLILKNTLDILQDTNILPENYEAMIPMLRQVVNGSYIFINTWVLFRYNPLAWGHSVANMTRGYRDFKKAEMAKTASIPETYLFAMLDGLFEAFVNNPALQQKAFIDATLIATGIALRLMGKVAEKMIAKVVLYVNVAVAASIVCDAWHYGRFFYGLNKFSNTLGLIDQVEDLKQEIQNAKQNGLSESEVQELNAELAAKLERAKHKYAELHYELEDSELLHIERIYTKARLSLHIKQTQRSHLKNMGDILDLLKNDRVFKKERTMWDYAPWSPSQANDVDKSSATQSAYKLFYSFYYHFIAFRCDGGEKCSKLYADISNLFGPYMPNSTNAQDAQQREHANKQSTNFKRAFDRMNASRIKGVASDFLRTGSYALAGFSLLEFAELKSLLKARMTDQNPLSNQLVDKIMKVDAQDNMHRQQIFSSVEIEALRSFLRAHYKIDLSRKLQDNEIRCDFDSDCESQYKNFKELVTRHPFYYPQSDVANIELYARCGGRLKLARFPWTDNKAIKNDLSAFISHKLWAAFSAIGGKQTTYQTEAIFKPCDELDEGFNKSATMMQRRFDYFFVNSVAHVLTLSTNVPGYCDRIFSLVTNRPFQSYCALDGLEPEEFLDLKILLLRFPAEGRYANLIRNIREAPTENDRYKRIRLKIEEIKVLQSILNSNRQELLGRKLRVPFYERWHLKSKLNAIIAICKELALDGIFSAMENLKHPKDRLADWALIMRKFGLVGRIGASATTFLGSHSTAYRKAYHMVQFFCNSVAFVYFLYDLIQVSDNQRSDLERATVPIVYTYFICSQFLSLIHNFSAAIDARSTFVQNTISTVQDSALFNLFGYISQMYSLYSIIPPDWKVVLNTYDITRSEGNSLVSYAARKMQEGYQWFDETGIREALITWQQTLGATLSSAHSHVDASILSRLPSWIALPQDFFKDNLFEMMSYILIATFIIIAFLKSFLFNDQPNIIPAQRQGDDNSDRYSGLPGMDQGAQRAMFSEDTSSPGSSDYTNAESARLDEMYPPPARVDNSDDLMRGVRAGVKAAEWVKRNS